MLGPKIVFPGELLKVSFWIRPEFSVLHAPKLPIFESYPLPPIANIYPISFSYINRWWVLAVFIRDIICHVNALHNPTIKRLLGILILQYPLDRKSKVCSSVKIILPNFRHFFLLCRSVKFFPIVLILFLQSFLD